jgi:large subunit ribosomal protein L4
MATQEKTTTAPKLPTEVFSVEFNESLVHQALTSYMSNQRQGSVLLKNRSAVRGGGRKPWRQKGTGRARAGTIRSPLWVGGGVTFAHTKNHEKKINKKMAKKALASILSKFNSEKRLTLVKDVNFKEPKTKMAEDYFTKTGHDSALLITNDADQNTMLAIRNLKNFSFLDAKDINPYDLMKAKHILLTHSALPVIEESLKC